MKFIIALLAFALAGCTAISQEVASFQKSRIEVVSRDNYVPPSSEGKLHWYVERLARQLFDTANSIDVNRSIIVGTFVPAQTLKLDENIELQKFGLQLQESFATFSTQAGLNVVEFKTLPGVQITETSDLMLSRDIEQLSKKINAEYMLTGTYVQQENSLIVNVRLISVSDKSLVAAATDYLPLNSMWSHSKVKMTGDQLYRGEY